MTNYTCTKCGVHKNTGGYSVCRNCTQDEITALHKENSKLKAELKQKDEKLSEFIEGLPIEKADKELTYYYETGGAWFQTKYIDGAWVAWDLYKNSNQSITEKWLYRFPSTETQMEGE